MEHFKSTIVTTAVLVMGLITAGNVLHPRDPASETRRARAAIAPADVAAAWSDPPARARAVATGTETIVLRPASFTLLPVAMTARLPGTEDSVQVGHVRKAEAVRGRKPVPPGVSNRSASIGTRTTLQASNPVVTTAQASQTPSGDPIGDLLKALGLGRDS